MVDTLGTARELHPGKKNSLDALCERYQIDNSHRTLHGALLDATLLAEVYLAMTRGQESLAIGLETTAAVLDVAIAFSGERPRVIVLAGKRRRAGRACAPARGDREGEQGQARVGGRTRTGLTYTGAVRRR